MLRTNQINTQQGPRVLRHASSDRTCLSYEVIYNSDPDRFSDKMKSAVSFLTRGYARAYHELLQGQGYANESLAHS